VAQQQRCARLSFTPTKISRLRPGCGTWPARFTTTDESRLGTLDCLNRNCDCRATTANGYSDERAFEREQIALTHNRTPGFSVRSHFKPRMHNTTETFLGAGRRNVPAMWIGNDSGISWHADRR